MSAAKGSRRRAGVIAVVVFIAVFAGAAQAASVITGPAPLGAGAVAAECQSAAVTPDWDYAYDPSIPGHRLSAVRLEGLEPSCLGRQVVVVLADASGAQVAAGTGTTPTTGTSATVELDTGVELSGPWVRQLSVVIHS